jgi:DNA-binding transcriptional MerR regulator
MGKSTFFIGELARQTGTNPKTVRYYEYVDLLPRPKRGANNYRVYSRDTVRRLEFIRKAQTLGFTLREIREILGTSDRGIDPCRHIGELLNHRLAALENRLKELKSLRARLKKLEKEWSDIKSVKECNTGEVICPKIEKYFLNAWD